MRGAKKGQIEPFGGLLAVLGEQMAIDVKRRLDAGVAHLLLDIFGAFALGD